MLRQYNNSTIRDGRAKEPNPFATIKGQSLNSIIREKVALDDDEFDKFITYEPNNKIEQFG